VVPLEKEHGAERSIYGALVKMFRVHREYEPPERVYADHYLKRPIPPRGTTGGFKNNQSCARKRFYRGAGGPRGERAIGNGTTARIKIVKRMARTKSKKKPRTRER